MFQKMMMSMTKGKGKGKVKMMMKGGWGESLSVDPALKVWIGSLSESVTWKELQEHMNQAGKTRWVEVFTGKGAGTGAVSYATDEEAASAIATLNGSMLGGVSIVCDTWDKSLKEE